MWFAISSPPPIWCPSFSFIGGVAKEYTTKLGHILSITGDALTVGHSLQWKLTGGFKRMVEVPSHQNSPIPG
jgi:hypothetical protein